MNNSQVMTYNKEGSRLINASCWQGNPEGWYKWYFSSSEYSWIHQDSKNKYATGQKMIDGRLYEFDSDGLLKGWYKKEGGEIGYIDPDNTKINGWQQLCGETYYFDNNLVKTGLQVIDGERYFFDNHGCLKKGWIMIEEEWHLFDLESGEEIRDAWSGSYYLKHDGTMAADEWIGGYYFGSDGIWIQDKISDN